MEKATNQPENARPATATCAAAACSFIHQGVSSTSSAFLAFNHGRPQKKKKKRLAQQKRILNDKKGGAETAPISAENNKSDGGEKREINSQQCN